MMNKVLIATLISLAACSTAANAETSTRFFTNDYIGDGHDRWRSGSYTVYWGNEDGPAIFGGSAYDFRLRTEIISPWDPAQQGANNDRHYSSQLAIGAFINDRYGMTDLTFGGEVIVMGDQNGLPSLQHSAHKLFGIDGYDTKSNKHTPIEDKMTGMVSAEMASNYFFGDKGLVRPYASAQAGYETFLRFGADFAWGSYSLAERYVRDPATGFIKPHGPTKAEALSSVSFVAGIDYTAVTKSDLFPNTSQVDLEAGRWRGRAGVNATIGPVSVFYGATYLTKEFKTQTEDQVLGTLSLELPF